MTNDIETNDNCLNKTEFSKEETFHTSGNVLIWGEQKPHQISKHVQDSPKVNTFCALRYNTISFHPFLS